MSYLGRDIYAMLDSEDVIDKKAFIVSEEKALELNKKGYGIFWTVNYFAGQRRLKVNLKKCLSWYVEIDGVNKKEQIDILNQGPYPSLIVESKRGYHAYWDIQSEDQHQSEEKYRSIQERIIHFFGGDKNAKDSCRILRHPGFNHLKNMEDPFEVKVVHKMSVSYRITHMDYWFCDVPEETDVKHIPKAIRNLSGSLYENLTNADNEEILKRLSGTAAVGFETYDFKLNANGNKNIIVNGKGTSCFLDKNGLIGSSSGGGPTIWQWLRYFNHSHARIYSILKHHAPEVFSEHT